MGEANQSDQRNKFISQMEELGRYAKKCAEGYKPLDSYLNSLYGELDELMDLVPEEHSDQIKKSNSNYKSVLENGKEILSNYDNLDKLVKKVLSGSIENPEEAKEIMTSINKEYGSIVNTSVQMYQLLDPEIDTSKLINGIYLQLSQAAGKDIKLKFMEGLSILKKYYISEEIIENVLKKAA